MKSLADPAATSELVSRLESVERDSERRWGTLTAHEMLCHVADACEVSLGLRAPSAMTFRGPARLIKILALWAPIPWAKGVATGAGVDPRREGTRPSDFARDRERAIRLLRELASSAQPRPHPIFGTMTAREWLRWGYLHADHHLRQFGC